MQIIFEEMEYLIFTCKKKKQAHMKHVELKLIKMHVYTYQQGSLI